MRGSSDTEFPSFVRRPARRSRFGEGWGGGGRLFAALIGCYSHGLPMVRRLYLTLPPLTKGRDWHGDLPHLASPYKGEG